MCVVLVLLFAQRERHSSEDGGQADTVALIGSARARLLLAIGAGKLTWACQMKEERLKLALKLGHCVGYGAPPALHVLWLLFAGQC